MLRALLVLATAAVARAAAPHPTENPNVWEEELDLTEKEEPDEIFETFDGHEEHDKNTLLQRTERQLHQLKCRGGRKRNQGMCDGVAVPDDHGSPTAFPTRSPTPFPTGYPTVFPTTAPPSPPPSACTNERKDLCGMIKEGDRLEPGDVLINFAGWKLCYRLDGNLEVHDGAGETMLDTHSAGKPNGYLKRSSNGDLVMRNGPALVAQREPNAHTLS